MGFLKLLGEITKALFFSANELLAQVISFLLLLFILKKFLWTKFLKVLDARREKIAADLKKIEDTKMELEGIRRGYNEKMLEIDKAASQKMEAAVAEGRRVAEEVRQGAERDAQKFLENAKAAIEDEVSKARETLKGDIVDITIEAAEKVIEEKLTQSSDRKIVEDFLKKGAQ